MHKFGKGMLGMMMCGGVLFVNPISSFAETVPMRASKIVQVVDGSASAAVTPQIKTAFEGIQKAEEDLIVEVKESAASEEIMAAQGNAVRRQQVVDYALSFVGGRYVYGGNDPHTGVDCSGFVRYVLANSAGVSMGRSSGVQASQGRAIDASRMQPGDLLFYGNRGGINHVAMYIGSGQIVHASTARTGITISNWNYRNPVKIISVLD